MLKPLFKLMLGMAAVTILITACRKKKTNEENESELITTVNLKFTPVAGGTTLTYTFRDIDGPGGAAPTKFDEIILAPSTPYNFAIELLDESKTPPENITEEVEEEGTDHELFYIPAGGIAIAVSNLSTDANGLPLGISGRWTTSAVSAGTVRVVLKHKPDNKKAGDNVNAGETDIDLSWPARIQ